MDLTTLKIILAVVLWSIGWYKVIDNVLWHFGEISAHDLYIKIKNPILKALSKPIWACIVCYGSFWGTIGYLWLNDGFNVLEWVFVCVASAGINAIVNNKLL